MSVSYERRYSTPLPEEGYQPWERCSPGSQAHFRLVPTVNSGEKAVYIPYLQAMSMEIDRSVTQLGLICPASRHIVFIEGRLLNELANLLSAREVRAIYVHDPAEDGEIAQSKPVVKSIRVEWR